MSETAGKVTPKQRNLQLPAYKAEDTVGILQDKKNRGLPQMASEVGGIVLTGRPYSDPDLPKLENCIYKNYHI